MRNIESEKMPLEIEYVDPQTLTPHPKNPNVHPTSSVLALQTSLETFNWTGPIKVQKGTNIIVGGHGMWAAAKLKGFKKIPIVKLELTDEQALAYMIADNQLSQLSHWDERELTRVLEELKEKDVNLLDLGFEKHTLESILPELAGHIETFQESIQEMEVQPLKVETPLRWFGGKYNLSKWIINQFPPHRCYVEPFGGSGAVLLRKPISAVEVYNDINELLINFFKCLKNDPKTLLSEIVFLPYSRQLHDRIKEMTHTNVWPHDIAVKAAMWFYWQYSSFSGVPGGGWSHGWERNKAIYLNNMIGRLFTIAMRLKRVQIEHRDFKLIFKIYDSKDTFFYCDPPYIGVRDRYAKSQFTIQDHKDLAIILNKIKGKACTSYYPHPFVDNAYRKWRRLEKQVKESASSSLKKGKRTELLLMNY